MTRGKSPKPYTRDDVDRIGWDMRLDGPRLYATVDALTAAQGEVAVLMRLVRASSKLACPDCDHLLHRDPTDTDCWACDGDGVYFCDCTSEHRIEPLLASTRATAAAHDERVRREALEALNQVLDILMTRGQVFDSAEYRCNHALKIGRDKADALAHPTKGPK